MEVPDPVLVAFLATCYQVLVAYSAIPDLALEANLDQDATVFLLARSDDSPLVAESRSVARFPVEAGSGERSRQIQAATDAQDGQERSASLDQDDREKAAMDALGDQVRVDHNRDLPDETDETDGTRANCYQDARQDRRCNTKLRRGLMPFFYLIQGF